MTHRNGPIPTTIATTMAATIARCDVVEMLFDRVEQIVDGRDPIDLAIGPDAASDLAVDAAALERVVSALALQLWHALGLTASDEDRRDLAMAAVEEASSLRRSSAAALDAIISMVEAVVLDDVAWTVGPRAAADRIDVLDLFEAAVSVSAAITWNVADRLALDPMQVAREPRTGATNEMAGPSACRSFRGRLRRREGQTWSGRNSQCHGSRGTASTHPNLGPLVFNH